MIRVMMLKMEVRSTGGSRMIENVALGNWTDFYKCRSRPRMRTGQRLQGRKASRNFVDTLKCTRDLVEDSRPSPRGGSTRGHGCNTQGTSPVPPVGCSWVAFPRTTRSTGGTWSPANGGASLVGRDAMLPAAPWSSVKLNSDLSVRQKRDHVQSQHLGDLWCPPRASIGFLQGS